MYDLENARNLDMADPLSTLRTQFELPRERVYLDGNSLGALPIACRERLAQVVDREWGQGLIDSWNGAGWIDLPHIVGEKIAALIGAGAGQVVCADSTSINLFKLLAAALPLNPGRHVILSEEANFPTDLYMAQGLQQLLGVQRCELKTVAAVDLESALDNNVAIVMLTHVDFRTGRCHDMRQLTALAHERGALVLWDLAHSAGVMPVELDAWGVDMAVGCGYKFLNGGPGAPAFLYLARRWQAQSRQPLSGWMGHRRVFDFDSAYEPALGVERFLCGTPGILGMSTLDTALDIYKELSVADLRLRSTRLTQWFIEGVASDPVLADLHLLSPQEAEHRGSQVSLAHPQGYAIAQALIEAGVLVDFRDPDIVRFGFAPLYNSYEDAWRALEMLHLVMQERRYESSAYRERKRVT